MKVPLAIAGDAARQFSVSLDSLVYSIFCSSSGREPQQGQFRLKRLREPEKEISLPIEFRN
jgi:hypothetical protein